MDKKKPDPMIYVAAAERLGLDPAACMCIEDSTIGLMVGSQCPGSLPDSACQPETLLFVTFKSPTRPHHEHLCRPSSSHALMHSAALCCTGINVSV